MKTMKVNGYTMQYVEAHERDKYLTDSDREMDLRATAAVEAAIQKAKICKKPIARYDVETREAYLEYSDGTKKYTDGKVVHPDGRVEYNDKTK